MRLRRVITVLLLLVLLCCPPTVAEAKLVSDGLGNVYDDGLPDDLPPQEIVDNTDAADDEQDEDEFIPPPIDAEDEDYSAPAPIEPEDVVIPGGDEDAEQPGDAVPQLCLTDLELAGLELEPGFDPDHYRYDVYTTTDVRSVWVSAEAEYGRIYINSQRCDERSVTLTGESKDINILVQEDGDSVSYCVTVHRSAPAVEHTLYLQIGHSFALLDGEPLYLEAPAEIAAGRTMVPLRLVAEALGAAVAWEGTQRRVDIAYGGQLLQLFVGVAAEGLDVPPYIKNDRTMVPLRYIMETFGADVSWNAADKSITITFVEGE